MYALLREAEKLASFKGGPGRVTREDVRLLVSSNPDHPPWDLTDAIMRRQAGEALQVLTEEIEMGKETEVVLGLLGWLGSFYRNLLKVRGLVDRRESPGSAVKLLKARSEWKVKKDMEQVSRLSERDLLEALEVLLQTDLAIKRGARGRDALESAVIRLCGLGGSRGPR